MNPLLLAFFTSLGAMVVATPPVAELSFDITLQATVASKEEHLELLVFDAKNAERAWPARLGEAEQISLPTAGGPWRVTCRGTTSWCPTLALRKDRVPADLVLPVYPAIAAVGELLAPEGEKSPGQIGGQGWLHPTGRAKQDQGKEEPAEPIEFFIEAEVVEGRFELWLPRGRLDLRFAVEGFVPIYRWGWLAGGEEPSLGRLRLRRGGSVAGFVRDMAMDLPAVGAEIRLSPKTAQVMVGGERERFDLAQAVVKVDAEGFFQLVDLQPGSYRLRGERQDLASYSLPVEVAEEAETFIDEILLSSRPSLEVLITPPTTPKGEAWLLLLLDLRNQGIADLEATTDEEGRAFFAYVDPAEYLLYVEAERGRPAHQETLRVEEDLTLPIELTLLPLRGRITLGGEPLVVDLEVNSGAGEKWPFTSNAEGFFSGWARPPDYELMVVGIESKKPEFKRDLYLEDDAWGVREGVLEVAIDLPGNAIAGRVVDAQGQGVGGATVRALRGNFLEGRAQSDPTGAFRLPALAPGEVEVLAEHRHQGGSAVEMLSIPKEGVARVTLVLDAGKDITGQLLSANGQPVVGAKVAVTVTYPRPARDTDSTDLEGRFRLHGLPQGSPWMQVVVRAPSQMYWSTCLRHAGEDLELRLPPGPGGEVRLEMDYLPAGPIVYRGSPTVLRRGGSTLDASRQYAWRQLLGIDPNPETLREGLDISRLPAMAPGWYAALRLDEPWWRLAERVCTGNLPVDLDWKYLGPGGQIDLYIDSRPLQREKLRSSRRFYP